MIKKTFISIFLFLFVFSFNASAKKMEIIENIEPLGEFYVYSDQKAEVAQILGMDSEQLNTYCNEQGIAYLAVNSDNTKQIKVTQDITDFSNSIINISSLSNDNINSLIPDITGVADAKGEIVNKSGQKFIKVQFKTTDSGGAYVLTQYFTIANKMNIVLSFYTDINADTEYIDKTFESFSSPLFINNEQGENTNLGTVLLIAAIAFGIACLIIAFTVIRDLRIEKTEALKAEEISEDDN